MLASMNNSAGLPPSIYDELIQFPVTPPAVNTVGGWGYTRELTFAGNTARGEFCGMRVNTDRKRGFVYYINAYFNEDDLFTDATQTSVAAMPASMITEIDRQILIYLRGQ